MNLLLPVEIEEIRENIGFRKYSIELSSYVSVNRNLLGYIEDFCKDNNIIFKYVGQSIVVYPADYNDLNPTRFDLSNAYVTLIAWNESNDYDDIYDEYPITDLYWVDIEDEINSLEDLENILLTIRDTKQVPEAYYTEEEVLSMKKDAVELKKNRFKQKMEKKNIFLKKCQKFKITEEDFLDLLDAYENIK